MFAEPTNIPCPGNSDVHKQPLTGTAKTSVRDSEFAFQKLYRDFNPAQNLLEYREGHQMKFKKKKKKVGA